VAEVTAAAAVSTDADPQVPARAVTSTVTAVALRVPVAEMTRNSQSSRGKDTDARQLSGAR
jgi:hypothetical protein